MHFASYLGHVEILKKLLELGANSNILTDDQWTPLKIACYQGLSEIVKVLVNHPQIQINKMSGERGTALHIASMCGYADIVRLLINHKASCNLEDQYGRTPIELASNQTTLEVFNVENLDDKASEDRPLSFSGEVYCTAA